MTTNLARRMYGLAEPPYAALDTSGLDELAACLEPIAARLRETGSR